jgi:hypothetical protein
LHLLAEGRFAHGNDADNAAKGAQIGCESETSRAQARHNRAAGKSESET